MSEIRSRRPPGRPLTPAFLAGLLGATALLSCSTAAERPSRPAAPVTDRGQPVETVHPGTEASGESVAVEPQIPGSSGNPDLAQEAHLDDLAWQELKASGDVEAVKAWREAHPDSPHSREAEELWEDLRYAQVSTDGSLDSCGRYLREFPAGRFAAAVHKKQEALEWQAVAAKRNPEAIRRWLERNPDSGHAEQARAEWERLRASALRERPSVEACDLYLREFPNGPHAGEARALREEARAWEEAKRRDTVREYLRVRDRFADDSGFRRLAEERASPRYWNEAVARNPKSDHALTQLAESCLVTAACPLADVRKLYQRAVALNPNNPQALLGLARLRHDAGDREGARQLLERSLALDPRNAETHFYLGLLAAVRNDCQTALRHFDRAIALAPDFLAAFFHRASCKARSQGCRQALPDFRKVVALAASPADAKYLRQAEGEIRSCR